MSIYGAMFSGVSGLAANSQSLGMIADNISNVNTVGYKTTRASFSTLVTATRSASAYSPGGVKSAPQSLIDRQGLLQSSISPTDIAISGNGFFVVNTLAQPTATTGSYMYTRAGQFTADQNGFLRNAAGLYLQGWPIDATGNIPTNRSDLTVLQTINLNAITGSAMATTTASVKANLEASQAVSAGYTVGDMAAGTTTPHFERSIEVIDSQGGARTVRMAFLKTATNTWSVEVISSPAADTTGTNGLIASGDLTFNTDGSLATVPAGLSTLSINWAAGLGITTPQAVTFDYGTIGTTDGVTQFASASELIETSVDGAVFGALAGVSIDEEGIVTALFDNGNQQQIYKLPVAIFPNPNGLGNKQGNAYIATDTSGPFNLQEAGIGTAGKIAPNALEASTVDLAEEFTNMITTQRAYSASSRIITTADDMLEELIRIKR